MMICSNLEWRISSETNQIITIPIPSPDRSRRLQDIEILQNVWERVESEDPQTAQTNPDPAKNQRDEGGRNCEEVNESVEMEHEDQLVIGSNESHEEVGNEQHVEYEVELNNTELFSLSLC